ILLIGLLNLGWSLLYEYHNGGLNLYSDDLGASNKLILASALIFYIDRLKVYIDKDTLRKFFFFATALG
ncbi:O-antigen ligase family protein, partial [Escherichia coli]|nr:O-antigen ligase family protein [Escherichia coli]